MKEWVKSSIKGYFIGALIIFILSLPAQIVMTAFRVLFDLKQMGLNIIFSLILAIPIGLVHGIVMYVR